MRRLLTMWIAWAAFGLMIALACGDLKASEPGQPEQPAVTGAEELKQLWLSTYADLRNARPLTGTCCNDLEMTLLAKAQADECFVGVGEENIYPFNFDTQDCLQGRPKVNQSYVFGLTKSGDDLWLGIVTNMVCLASSAVFEQLPGGWPTIETPAIVCEFGESRFGQEHGLPDGLGDWRPPAVYTYNTQTGILTDRTPDDELIWQTMGLRSAGTLGNVVLLAGPTLTGMGGPAETAGIIMFAYDATTYEYLGSAYLEEYNDIRKWIAVNGVLYTGVLNNPDLLSEPDLAHTGSILRWAPTQEDLFNFERVGWLDGEGVELAEHEGRLFVSTWPDLSRLFDLVFAYAGVWMSPLIVPDGLHEADAEQWQKVWSAADYERDEVTARMYNGGALASFDGYLYWGSLHAPMLSGMAHAMSYGLIDPDNLEEIDVAGVIVAMLATHRPISIFRGRDFGTVDEELEVVYGLPLMPAYVENPLPWGPDRFWMILPNGMGPPVWGMAGFGNLFNTYTWTMAVYQNQLYVGTQDWSHIADQIPAMFMGVETGMLSLLKSLDHSFGGDLWRFASADAPAVSVDIAGIGNWASYGVRTMVSDDALYLGMANAMSLLTDPDDELPEGGWELIRLVSRYDLEGIKGDYNGDGVLDLETDWPELAKCFSWFGDAYTDSCCVTCDFDDDGDVDLPDVWAFCWASLSQ